MTAVASPTTLTLRPKQLSQLLSKTIPARLPVLVTGAPGVGKSDIISQAAEAAGADLLLSHPVVEDPTDAKGLPWKISETEAGFLPFGQLKKAMSATKLLLWFLDDLGQASPAVQASYMQLLLAREVNGHKLPDSVVFVAATNRRTDRAGVSGILEPVKSRFACIVETQPTLNDWCEWALEHNITPELIAFLRFRPELLIKFDASADMTNSPTPRTWSHAGKLTQLGLTADVELCALSGAVGPAAAAEYISFLRIYRELPNLDVILMNPDSFEVPKSANTLYALSAGVAHKATKTNFERVCKVADRLMQHGKGEFSVLLVRDAVKRDQELSNTPAFIKLMVGKLGKLIQGE